MIQQNASNGFIIVLLYIIFNHNRSTYPPSGLLRCLWCQGSASSPTTFGLVILSQLRKLALIARACLKASPPKSKDAYPAFQSSAMPPSGFGFLFGRSASSLITFSLVNFFSIIHFFFLSFYFHFLLCLIVKFLVTPLNKFANNFLFSDLFSYHSYSFITLQIHFYYHSYLFLIECF